MRFNGITIWAVSATAAALLMAGVLVGKSLQPLQSGGVVSIAAPQSTEPGAEPVEEHFQVPAWMQAAPTEWYTAPDGSREGYALLFDPVRRELLIEQCGHLGYFDAQTNRPRAETGPSCTRILTGELLEVTEDSAMVFNKEGVIVQIDLVATITNETAQLEMRYDNLHLHLVPGQTNDLINAIAKLPEIQNEYQQRFEFEQQQMKQQRAQMAAGSADGIPQFKLPASVLEAHEAAREADRAAETEQ